MQIRWTPVSAVGVPEVLIVKICTEAEETAEIVAVKPVPEADEDAVHTGEAVNTPVGIT